MQFRSSTARLRLKQGGALILWGWIFTFSLIGTVVGQTTVESFGYPDGELHASSGGRWTVQTASSTATPADGALTVVNGAALINQGDLTTGRERLSLAIASAFTPTGNAVAYFACDATWLQPPVTGTGSYFMHLSVTTNEPATFYARLGANLNGAAPGFFRATVANANWTQANAVSTPTDLALNTTYRLVVRYDLSNQTTTLWVNPLAEIDPSATATDAAAGAQKSIAAISLRQGLSNSSSGAPGQILIDNLAVGQRFDDVLTTSAPIVRQPPTNVVVTEGLFATFAVMPENPGGVRYSWTRNGDPIPGATNASLQVGPVVAADDQAQFRVSLSNRLGSVTSNPAVLTVQPDRTPLLLLAASNDGLTQVTVQFSKPVDPATAVLIANYGFSPPVGITSARLGDSQSVQLTVSPLALDTQYTLTVNGVRDRSSQPNSVAANSKVRFTAATLQSVHLGGSDGQSLSSGNGMDLTAAVGGIGGAADKCQFSYRVQVGDFDVRTRVVGMSQSGPFGRAALMARATLDPGGPTTAVIATPSMAGCLFVSRANPNDPATESGSFPVNYPQTWLRLQRIGNTVNGYASFDGIAWTPLGSGTLTTPSVYLGWAVAGADGSASAQFRDLGDVVAGLASTQSLPHEPIGPSSRRTQLVFSEIMYTPAARSDSRNLEFIEIYNSNPWWDDISGYQIAGLVTYTFPPNTILAGGSHLVIAAAPGDLQAVYGITNVMGPYSGHLKKTGQLQLINNIGGILLDTTYADTLPWPAGAHGTGHSIILANPSYGEADPRAWSVSDAVGGSPGGADPFTPNPIRNVVINEFLAHHDSSHLAFIELYNHSAVPVDLTGCQITRGSSNSFTLPIHSVIPAGGYLAFTGDTLGFEPDPTGGRLQLWLPDLSRVVDSISYDAQGLNVSWGRWPNGAADFYPLGNATPGSANADPGIAQVVINELMYKPISGDDDDQYIELLNRGSSAVDLSFWSFVAGPSFQFNPGTILPAGGLLVVARNQARLFSHYPQLSAANTVGDFTGRIPHGGGRVALARPEVFITRNANGTLTTNLLPVVEDEVTFARGGRWGQWAHGGGSSLELIHPDTNHRLASNWADSDESQKSSWTNLVVTGVLDNGANYGSYVDQVQLGLLDVGEALVDSISVQLGTTGPNLLKNGDFEQGFTNWITLGDHQRSSLETAAGLGGFASPNSVHLRSSDAVWVAANSVQGTLTSGGLASGKTATLSLAGRWLHGSPEVLLRLHGNWLELTGAFPVPANLGTPGLPNSRRVSAAPPAIYAVTHSPSIPLTRKPVVVTAQFHGTGITPALRYRIDTQIDLNPSYTSVPMVDDGTGGDSIAGDGIFSATIPGQAGGTVVAFLVTASSSTGASSQFPSALPDNSGLPRECVFSFGDPTPGGTFGHYQLWMTQNWINRWAGGGGLSNEGNDATFADAGGRVIYNIDGRFAGSPYHQYLGSPVTTLGGQHWNMPADDMMLGTTSFNKQHVPGNGTLDDQTLQREQTSYWLARQLKVPWSYRRYYILYVNGNRHGPLMEDSQVPGGDLLAEYFPNDSNGFLYKNNAWFEFEPQFNSSQSLGFNNDGWCTFNRYNTTVAGVTTPKLGRYRWNYWMRQTPDSANNYTNVYALIDAANLPSGPAYADAMESLVDTGEFMRMAALEHLTGDWDSFTTQNQWNMYSYKPASGRWTLLKWDWNITLGNSGSWGPDAGNLFTVSGSDPNMNRFQSYPPFRRAYLRALSEAANGPMKSTNVGPVLDAKFAAFRANGLPSAFNVAEPGANGLKQWIATMRQSILTTLNAQGVAAVPFAATVPTNQTIGDPTVTLTGSAPLEAETLRVNGISPVVRWTTTKTWSMTLNLPHLTNTFVVTAIDHSGQPLDLPPLPFLILNTNAPASNILLPRINEWMASNKKTIPDPADNSFADWFELFNPNTTPLDLSGYFLTTDPGVPTRFKIPDGTAVPAHGFLLVWADGGLTGANDGIHPALHATFKLKKTGSLIALFDTTTNLVDSITFGTQASDVSGGRFPDGGPLIYNLISPTPGVGNLFSNLPPVLAATPEVQVAPGGTVTVTLAGRDPDSPPQSLLYTLDPATLPGPVLDPVGGVLQWSIDSSLAPGRYPLTVRVADNGTPSLSATQTVVVTVVGATGPGIAVAAPTLTNGQLNLSWSSTPGTVYRVQFSSDLGTDAWTDVPGDIPATGIISTLSTPLSTSAPYRFYRVVVVP